jgi:MoxR-like ATPase
MEQCVTFEELIGPANRVGLAMQRKCSRALTGEDVDALKIFFIGPPGTGKTNLAELMASHLATGTPHMTNLEQQPNVEVYNGANVSVDKVREWQRDFYHQTIFGDWRIILIDEIDKMPAQAKVLMLSFLDRLPSKRAIIATSNVDLDDSLDAKRTQGRFQLFKISPPEADEIAGLITRRYRQIPQETAIQLVTQRDVRAALQDARSVVDLMP